MISPSGSRASLPHFVLSLARSPSDRRRSDEARGISLPATPIPAFSTRTTQDFSGSLSIRPIPMPCSKTPAGSKPGAYAGPSFFDEHQRRRRFPDLQISITQEYGYKNSRES
jgi:hypothetical protein